MKYLIFLLMFLMSCGKVIPSIPEDVLAELQSDSNQMYNMSSDIDSYMASNFKDYTKKLKAGDTALIYIYSDGGDVDSAENIINSMTKLKTICIADKALSAAFEIYQHCTVRVYMDRTILMTHHHYMIFREDTTATAPELLVTGLDAYIQETRLLGKCAARMDMTFSNFSDKIAGNGGDWYLYGSDILKYHAADYHIKNSQIIKMIKK